MPKRKSKRVIHTRPAFTEKPEEIVYSYELNGEDHEIVNKGPHRVIGLHYNAPDGTPVHESFPEGGTVDEGVMEPKPRHLPNADRTPEQNADDTDNLLAAKEIRELFPEWFSTHAILKGFLRRHSEVQQFHKGRWLFLDIAAVVRAKKREESPEITDDQIDEYLQGVELRKAEVAKKKRSG